MAEDKDMHLRRGLDGDGDEERAGPAGASREKRVDDRNEELDESPVPDPEARRSTAEDDPGAD